VLLQVTVTGTFVGRHRAGTARRTAEMSEAARSVSTDVPPGMTGGITTQATWAVRESARRPFNPGRESSHGSKRQAEPRARGRQG
jgi:hypothetical protein